MVLRALHRLGNKKAVEELKYIYKNNEQIKVNDDMTNDILNEINEQNTELLRKKKKEKEMEKKKDKSFILNLLTKIEEPQESEQSIRWGRRNSSCRNPYTFVSGWITHIAPQREVYTCIYVPTLELLYTC